MERLVAALAALSAAAVIAAAGWVVVGSASSAPASGPAIATLDQAFNKVTWRQARTLVWRPGQPGQSLAARDAVLTGDLGRAVIAYASGLLVDVDPASRVLVVPPRLDHAGRHVDAVVVEAGEVEGRLQGGGAGHVLHFLDDHGRLIASLAAASGATPPRYRVRLGQRGTEVAIVAGRAQVTGGGKTVSLSAGQAAELGTGGGAPTVVTLAGAPRSTAPAVDARVDLSHAPAARVRLAWAPVDGAAGYHVEVGVGSGVRHLVADHRGKDASFAFRPTFPDTFSWRVSALDAEGHEGVFGGVRRFTVAALPAPAGAGAASAKTAAARAAAAPPLPALPLAPRGAAAHAVAQVVGRGLALQAGGAGRTEAIRGRIRLTGQDLISAERSAGLEVGRGLVLGVEKGSRVEVEGSGRDAHGRFLALRLAEGAVTGDLSGHAEPATLYLESGKARVTVRAGARVRASHHGGTLRVVAERGAVRLQAGGKALQVTEGHGVAIPDGAAPGALATLPAAPPLATPRDGRRFATGSAPPAIEFEWRAVEGASGYQVRISEDPQGSAVVYQGLSQSTILVDNALAPGIYYWTVRALDPRGFSSSAAPARRLVVTRAGRAAAVPTGGTAGAAQPAAPADAAAAKAPQTP